GLPIARFTDANPNANVDSFKVNVDWGDGQTTGDSVQSDGAGGFVVFSNHAYALMGTYTIKVFISDAGGSVVETQSRATVNGDLTTYLQPLVYTLSGPKYYYRDDFLGDIYKLYTGVLYRGDVGWFEDQAGKLPLSGYTARIDWGDGSSTT